MAKDEEIHHGSITLVTEVSRYSMNLGPVQEISQHFFFRNHSILDLLGDWSTRAKPQSLQPSPTHCLELNDKGQAEMHDHFTAAIKGSV